MVCVTLMLGAYKLSAWSGLNPRSNGGRSGLGRSLLEEIKREMLSLVLKSRAWRNPSRRRRRV